MNCASNKVWKFLIFKCFSIDEVAYPHSSNKEMYLMEFTGGWIQKNLRLISNLVYIDFLSRNAFDHHTYSIRTIVLFDEVFKMCTELCVLVSGRTLLLVLKP